MRTAIVLVVALAGAIAMATPRGDLARDFIRYLESNGLTVTITKQSEDDLELSIPIDGHVVKPSIALDNLERYLANAVANGAIPVITRQQLFAKYLATIRGLDPPAPTVAHDAPLIMPRLVLVGSMPADKVASAGAIGDTGLELVYVVDSEASVRFLSPAAVKSLGLDAAALRALAMKNLARDWPVEKTRKLLSANTLNLVKTMDTFDAARLLLLQTALKKGESTAALVPDRDTLVVVPVPKDGDWSKLRALARMHASGDHPLLSRPLLVTPDKIELR